MPTGKKITDPSIPQTGSGLSDFAGLLTLGVNSQNQSVRIPLGDILHRTIVRAGVIYRIDTEHPLTSGYYTLTTAIQTVAADVNVSDDERSGMVLIFYDGTVFRIYQFEKKYDNSGGVEPSVKFLNTDNWKELDLYSKADKADVYTKEEVDEMNEGMEENIVALMEKKADKTGLHHSLGSGTSDGLAGTDVVYAEYTLRCTGDKMSNLGTGAAAIETVKGNTLVWNQIMPATLTPNSGAGLTASNNNGVYSFSGTTPATGEVYYGWGTLPINPIVGHKYLLMIDPITWDVQGGSVSIALRASGEFKASKETPAVIVTASNTANNLRLYYDYNTSVDISFKINVIDLTREYGAGNEPSVPVFKQSFPLLCYDYNINGKLINNSASGIKTIGFNQWDEQWELGTYNSTTGEKQSYSDGIRSTNKIPVIAGERYYIKAPSTCWLFFYSDDIFLKDESGITILNNTITIPEGCNLMTFRCGNGSDIIRTYNNDICINLSWSGYRNGEYEPYEEHTVYFDSALGASGSLATIKGRKIVEGEPTGTSAPVFEGGMKSVNSVDTNGSVTSVTRDDAKGIYANKRILEVDLGNDFTWTYNSACGACNSNTDTRIMQRSGIMCTKYTQVSSSVAVQDRSDKTISTHSSDKRFILKDSAITASSIDEQGKISALVGVKAYVIMSTPETYLLDNPLPSCYAENKLGTEERLPKDTASAVNAPLKYTVKYPMNIAKNYVSADSISNLLSELATKFGAAMSKTITITPTFNENTQEFDYSINIT